MGARAAHRDAEAQGAPCRTETRLIAVYETSMRCSAAMRTSMTSRGQTREAACRESRPHLGRTRRARSRASRGPLRTNLLDEFTADLVACHPDVLLTRPLLGGRGP